MQRTPPYTICLYPDDQKEFISVDVREAGQWRECKLLPQAVREGIRMQVSRQLSAKHAKQVMQDFFLAADPFVSTNGVVVDVGANIGTCTFELGALGHHVYAFEAVAANVQLMEATKRANQFRGTVTVQHGLVSNVSRSHVRISTKLDAHNMGSQIVRSTPADGSTGRSDQPALPAWMLDDIVHEHVNMLKMDCQGCEYNAIFGAEKLFTEHGVDIVFMEVSTTMLRELTGIHDAATLVMLKLVDYGMTLWVGPEFSVPASLATHEDVTKYMAQKLSTGDFEDNLWAVQNSVDMPSFLGAAPFNRQL